MSLGGYKFAGRYCQKGSLTDAQWALKMHKTKVAAFMAANTLSGAGWDYDMTGSPDGNYHCLDSVGNNYVTVFKRTNGENDYTWFALYTLTKFTWSGTDSGAVKIWIIGNYTNMYIGYYATSFYRIGTVQISYSDDLSQNPSGSQSRTGLLPMGNPGTSTSDISSSYYPPLNTSLKDVALASFGYAIKGDSIIMLQGQGIAFLPSYLKCSVASGHGFSTFTNPNDEYGVFAYNTQNEQPDANNYENAGRDVTTTNLSSPLCAAEDGSSRQVLHHANLGVLPLATYGTTVQEYPFQALTVFNILNSTTKTQGKGTVSVDLLSMNFPGTNQGLEPDIYGTYANGKYLCVRKTTGTNYFQIAPLNFPTQTQRWNMALYVGWDPSNPDITQASSWTEYTE